MHVGHRLAESRPADHVVEHVKRVALEPSVVGTPISKFIEKRVELLNYALRGIPEDRVRFHTCYSTNVAPRVYDLELKDYIDLMKLRLTDRVQVVFEHPEPVREVRAAMLALDELRTEMFTPSTASPSASSTLPLIVPV